MVALNSLRLSRSADREALFAAVVARATQNGATVERVDYDREIMARVSLKGSMASVAINGDSAVPVPLISWVAQAAPGSKRGQCFAKGFYNAVEALRPAQPHNKATTIADDVEGMLEDLADGLELIGAGGALTFYIHPWAADTAWIGEGRPEPKADWIAHYRATGEALQ